MPFIATRRSRGRHHARAMRPPSLTAQARYILQHVWRRTRHPKAPLAAAHVQQSLPPAGPESARVTWVGHASFVVQLGGKTFLTDPVWSNGLAGGLRRLAPPGVTWEGLPRIDGIVVSHNHYDHLDHPTLRRLARDTPVFVPDGLGRWFRRRGFSDVTELDWWESATVGGVDVHCVPAHHWSRRTLWDTNEALWSGWVLGDGRHKVYFAGDTAYGPCFAQIGRRHPGIDAALMPIGAYAPQWYNGWAHLDPGQAVQAFQELDARHMVPMHYGAFRLSPDTASEALGWVREAWDLAGLPQERLWDDPPGTTRQIPAPHHGIRRPARPAHRPIAGLGDAPVPLPRARAV